MAKNKVYRAVKDYKWVDSALASPVAITKGQDLWQGDTTFSLCVANKRGDGCLPDQQWVSTYIVSSNVQEKLEALMGMGVVILAEEENDYVCLRVKYLEDFEEVK